MGTKTTTTVTDIASLPCKATHYEGHEAERAYWDTFLTRNEKGQNLLGLVEATAWSCDRLSAACARVPETFQDVGDIVAHALVTIHERGLLAQFDATRGNGEKGFPGYVKSCVSWITGSHVTDTLRSRSRTPSPDEAALILERMREDGVKDPKVPMYVPADRVPVAIKVGEDSLEEEMGHRGSVQKDWSVDCSWSATAPDEADALASEHMAVHAIMSRLTKEEGDAIRLVLKHGNVKQAAKASGAKTPDRMASLVKQARRRFEGTRQIVLGL